MTTFNKIENKETIVTASNNNRTKKASKRWHLKHFNLKPF